MAHLDSRTAAALLALALAAAPAAGQVIRNKRVVMPGAEPATTFTDAVSLPTDRDARRQLEAARDYVKKQNWEVVTDSLQRLLETPEDSFLEVERAAPDGGKRTGRVSVRAEANRMIGALPKEGREFYQLTYGRKADARLKEGVTARDPQVIAEVAQRYFHTAAGGKATAWLAGYHLDRGRALMASLCYERLLARPDAGELDGRTVFLAAVALKRAGNDEAAEKAWKKFLDGPAKGELRVGRRTLGRDDLRAELDRPGEAVAAGLADWAMFRGNPPRTAQGIGGSPFLDPRWSLELLPPESKGTLEPFGPALAVETEAELAQLAENKPANDWVRQQLKESKDRLATKQQAALPAFFPVAAAGKLVYRAYDGVYAVALRDDPSRQVKAGHVEWLSTARYGLHAMVYQPGDRSAIDNQWWGQNYKANGPHDVLFANALVGSLSHDGRLVYFVDDLALPPPPQLLAQMQFGGAVPQVPGKFNEAMAQSVLNAVDLETGKLVWDLGNLNVQQPKELLQALRKDHPAADAMFLGPPLPVAGKLYVLVEKNAELTLLCLDPSRPDPATANLRWPTVVWKQRLGTANHPLPQDSMRRLQAVQLAYADGILVCPTNAGAILGVDLLTHSLVWAHSYRTPSAAASADGLPVPVPVPLGRGGRVFRGGIGFNAFQQTVTGERWRPSAPAVADGKVVFTAHDMTEVHCLDLRDGSELLWRAPRAADDLYLAGVFAGHALIVGKSYARALKLADGTEAWKVTTGLPSGQGVASADVYYLPLAQAADSRGPEVCAIDLKTGKVLAHTRSRKTATRAAEVPGNLVFYGGAVYSQTDSAVTAYPQLKLKLEEIDRRLAARPTDPVGLTERAELRLDEGDARAAVGDLRTALAGEGLTAELRARARGKLYEALTDLLQRDFPAGEPFLAEYKELCGEGGVEETKTRTSRFLQLVAKGRERQGRLGEAFQAYLDYVGLHGDGALVEVLDEPNAEARPDVWARGRILAMLQAAKPADRKPLEERVAAEWKAVRSADDPKRLRDFVAVFGAVGEAGPAARLELAEKLLAAGRDEDFVEAENHLLQLRNAAPPAAAAKATEALARLMARKGLYESAVAYYRDLARAYPKEVVRDGKTGPELLDELVTDKRFLPYLEPEQGAWSGRFRGEHKHERTNVLQATMVIEPQGEKSAFLRRHQLVMDINQAQGGRVGTLRVVDRDGGGDYWKVPNLPWNVHAPGNTHAQLKPAHVRGHLLFLTLNEYVYAFDLLGRRKLWEFNLFGKAAGKGEAAGQGINQITEPDGGLRLIYPDGWTQKLGQVSVIEAGYVCLSTREGLVSLDPLTGTVLWRKRIDGRLAIFGDEQNVYVIEVDEQGQPTGTRAVSARDGSAVGVPDFAPLLAGGRAYRLLGRRVLVFEDHEKGKRLRLHDIPSGTTAWEKSFPAGTVPVRCEGPGYAGALEPDGGLTVVDLGRREVVLAAKLDARLMAGATAGALVLDRERFYVTVDRPNAPNVNLSPCVGAGLRSQPVDGALWAFDRSTGKLAWYDEDMAEQFLILERFEELPVLIAAVTYGRPQNGGFKQGARVTCLDKRTGKLVYDEKDLSNGQFTSLRADPAAGVIELVRPDLKVYFTAEPARGGRADARR